MDGGTLEQGSLPSVGLDMKPKKRRPMPQVAPVVDPTNALAQMVSQRPMMGTDPSQMADPMKPKKMGV